MAMAISLRKYPYTYLRTIFMKKKLLSKLDYDKILKMTPAEIGKYLEDFEYKNEIDELALEYKGVELVERALQLNLANKFEKLIRISPTELRALISIYLKRYDIYNIKTIIRSKFSGIPLESAKRYMSPVSAEKRQFSEKLLAQKSVEEVVSSLDFIEEKDLRSALEHFKGTKSLIYIENMLDKYYFGYVISNLKYFSTEGKLYKKFLLNEIDVINIKMLLIAKKESVPEQDIKKLVFAFGNIKSPVVDTLVKSDVAGIIKYLENTIFKSAVEKYSKEPEKANFTELEISLDKFLLEQSRKLIRQYPMSVDVILGYMFLKDIEVKNVERVMKAKQLELPEEFIEKIIVI